MRVPLYTQRCRGCEKLPLFFLVAGAFQLLVYVSQHVAVTDYVPPVIQSGKFLKCIHYPGVLIMNGLTAGKILHDIRYGMERGIVIIIMQLQLPGKYLYAGVQVMSMLLYVMAVSGGVFHGLFSLRFNYYIV